MKNLRQQLAGTYGEYGFILPAVLAFIIAMGILSIALLTVILNNFFVVGNNIKSQQAFNIAEAGINYYLWHMAHDSNDYRDGQSTPLNPDPQLGYGPYVHHYIDSNAVDEGTYTLWIKPQGVGSTIVTVRSIGQVKDGSATRTIDAKIGASSFASYGLVSDNEFWFGSDEAADGPVFSNVGVHMDGPNTDTVGSANASYVPAPEYGGNGKSHPGVWCDPSLDADCNTRDKTNWLYPQPSVDFNQVSGSLCDMKLTALADYSATSGYTSCSQVPSTRTNAYIPELSTSFSTTKGYLLVLKNTSPATYDLYKVNSENDTRTPYTSALGLTAVATGITLPPSGVVFVEDNVWVLSSGNFDGRVTIAAGRLATSNSTNIVIAGPLTYAHKDGSDAIGLVAENDIDVAPYAPPASGSFNFEIDAALLAGSGRVTYGEYQTSSGLITYRSQNNSCARGWVSSNQTFTFYGSVATRKSWTWNQQIGGSCGNAVRDPSTGYYIAGIEHTTTSYDYNMLYAPPPSYPVTGGFNIISWREVLTHP